MTKEAAMTEVAEAPGAERAQEVKRIGFQGLGDVEVWLDRL